MDNYIVSARKYRPRKFSQVVGQEALTATLKNSIAEGRLAHAYLFCGPRGVGKTTCARIFAKTINCEHKTADGEPCDECESCRAFNEGRSLNIYELDAASNNTVDDIRQIIEQVAIPPQYGHYKVFIIDEVHMLSKAAFNAFLKTLEEPPAHVIFILATTEKQKILPTILSRCQIYDFQRMSIEQIVRQLKMVAEHEGYHYDDEALNIIAQKADGGMRDALSLLDQVASFTRGEIFYENVVRNLNVLDYDYYFSLTDAFLQHDALKPLLIYNEILSKGFDGEQFVTGLMQHMRDLLVSRDASTLPLLEVAETTRRRYSDQAARASVRFLYRAMALLNRCGLDYRGSSNKRLLVELTLIELSQAENADAAPDAGPGPAKQLSPLFSATKPATPKTSTTPTVGVTASPTPTKATSPAPQPTPQPATATKVGEVPPQYKIESFSEILKKSRQESAPAEGSAQPAPHSTAATVDNKPRRTDADETEVQVEWTRFAAELPQADVAAATLMKELTPHKTATGRFEVVVDSEPFFKLLSPLVPKFEDYLRRRMDAELGVTLKLQVPDKATRQARTPQARLKQMQEKYEAVAKLTRELAFDVI